MSTEPAPAPNPTRFPLSEKVFDQIHDAFTYHAPTGSQPERYVAVREKAKELAILMAQCCHEGRELSTALTSLETAVMHCNAGIARKG